jgi:hypothetical protein
MSLKWLVEKVAWKTTFCCFCTNFCAKKQIATITMKAMDNDLTGNISELHNLIMQ